MPLTFKTLHSINDIDARAWNAITGIDYPFLRHEFLHALEASGAVGNDSGWQARHQLIYRDDELIGVMPLYRKYHSWGEYVFDWAWAQAYEKHGLNYYPKLVCAIPYTPAEGVRLILAKDQTLENIWPLVQSHLLQIVRDERCSSLHILFNDNVLQTALETHSNSYSLLPRLGVQYQWFNRHAINADEKPYANFADFLGDCNSRKRRSLGKERKKVITQNVALKQLVGTDISDAQWDLFYHCYQLTYLKRSGHGGYLNREFFRHLAQSMPEQILMVVAERDNTFIAAALCFIGSDTLYGRYWGCLAEVDGLHFEACYYQGIEFCIEHHLQRFDPGAQGEHKIARGFRPVFTHSWHYLADRRFQLAIKDFLQREQQHISSYRKEAETLLPFRHNEPDSN